MTRKLSKSKSNKKYVDPDQNKVSQSNQGSWDELKQIIRKLWCTEIDLNLNLIKQKTLKLYYFQPHLLCHQKQRTVDQVLILLTYLIRCDRRCHNYSKRFGSNFSNNKNMPKQKSLNFGGFLKKL